MWKGESPACLLALHHHPRTFSGILVHAWLRTHSSVSWAMLPAASNKRTPSPSPALGKQTRLGVGRTEEAGDHVPWHLCWEQVLQPGVRHHQQSSVVPSSSPLPTEGVLVPCSLALPLQGVGYWMNMFASVSEDVGWGQEEGGIKTRDAKPWRKKNHHGSALSSPGDHVGWKSSVQELEDLRCNSTRVSPGHYLAFLVSESWSVERKRILVLHPFQDSWKLSVAACLCMELLRNLKKAFSGNKWAVVSFKVWATSPLSQNSPQGSSNGPWAWACDAR